jgi:hypothetical protein
MSEKIHLKIKLLVVSITNSIQLGQNAFVKQIWFVVAFLQKRRIYILCFSFDLGRTSYSKPLPQLRLYSRQVKKHLRFPVNSITIV